MTHDTEDSTPLVQQHDDQQADVPTDVQTNILPAHFRSGFAALIGRPNVGKSTLLNTILGTKVSITTPKPQTTRNRILGVKTVQGVGQVILVDTPGLHRPRKAMALNRYMVDTALHSLGDSELLLLLIDAHEALRQGGRIKSGNRFILEHLKRVQAPQILVVNKIDTFNKEALLEVIDTYRRHHEFSAIVPISALTGDGVDILLKQVFEHLPEGPQYYPDDMLTDQAERFIVSEIIREKATLLTRKEIPYSLAVTLDTFSEDPGRDLLRIDAVIHVERTSQKGILIGKGGKMLKRIGTNARTDIERFFAKKVFLTLFVKVQKNWSEDPRSLGNFGYRFNC